LKEDVLEQIVDDYLNFKGYFTTHNVPFRPDPSHARYESRLDSVPSDIDVIGIHPQKRGRQKVIAVNCKSWQSGFRAKMLLEQLRNERKNPKRETWHRFRELWVPKWSEAFRQEILERTGAKTFTYRIAVTRMIGSGDDWTSEPRIKENLPGCEFGFLRMEEMWKAVVGELTKRPAPSEIGRLAQLLKAAGLAEP
jgi:hypothetical protein